MIQNDSVPTLALVWSLRGILVLAKIPKEIKYIWFFSDIVFWLTFEAANASNFSRLDAWISAGFGSGPWVSKELNLNLMQSLSFKSSDHCLDSQQQPFGLFSSAASQFPNSINIYCVWTAGRIKMGYGRIWDIIVRQPAAAFRALQYCWEYGTELQGLQHREER